MSIVFGDAEADDSYVEDNQPDPEQVARRLHELREAIDQLVGRNPAPYDELTEPEQQIAAAVALVIIEWIIGHEPDQAEQLAINLHNVRRHWSRGALPPWDQLNDDERELAVTLMRLIIEWLQREGTP